MKKIIKKIPAKINLTLDVVGLNGPYHEIKSLVASIDVYDTITVSARKDNKITLTLKGLPLDCPITENNAYKAAKLFYKGKSLCGVNVIIDKKIPIGGGLGGSSADIAGVLLALKELHQTDDELLSLANELGSDSGYMLSGGYAIISGRGDKISKVDCDKELYLLLITTDGEISARASYKIFDEMGIISPSVSDIAKDALISGELEQFANCLKNDLYQPALKTISSLEDKIDDLKHAGAINALLTGSGPTVFGIFDDEKARDKAYRLLKSEYGDKLIKAQTVGGV